MSTTSISDLRAAEKPAMDYVRKTYPELLQLEHLPDADELHAAIGVTFLPQGRPLGYLRLYPQDFIVEEITNDGQIVALSSRPAFEDIPDRRTLWAELVKVGMNGSHAIRELESQLHLASGSVTTAGIKDTLAVTAQQIALRGATREAVDAFEHQHMWLRPVSYGSGVLAIGQLKGNRFTITVRTEDGKEAEPYLERLRSEPAWNYFGGQRFGTRVMSHHLGQMLLQGNIDECLEKYLTATGPFDVPLFIKVRGELADAYGDWERMLKIAKTFPYNLRDEIRVLESLVKTDDARQSFGEIKDQVRLWFYAYGSWLINRYISQQLTNGESIPDELRMQLASDKALPEYAAFLKEDGTEDFRSALTAFPYINATVQSIPAKMQVEDVSWKRIDQGYVVRFSLGKGSYATALLSYAFKLKEGLPVPPWAKEGELDGLEIFGDGNLAEIKKRFARSMLRRDLIGQDEEA